MQLVSRPLDRSFLIAMLLTALVVIPRSLSIAHAHSESWDDQYHLLRGLAQWRGDHLRMEYNDPPFGEMILATPLWATGCTVQAPARDASVIAHGADPGQCALYGQPYSPETLLMLVSGWKAILFLPGAAVIFLWCRRLYGDRAAWLALIAVLADPTIAAHASVGALDVFALEAELIACYLAWRSFESPHPARLVATCAAMAAAMTIKLTAVFVLPTWLAFAVLYWWIRPWMLGGRGSRRAGDGETPGLAGASPSWRARRRVIAAVALLGPLFIWSFTFFDISRPSERGPVMSANYTEHWSFAADVVNANMSRHWPAGIFIASLANGAFHSSEGHLSYLMGQAKRGGWWYYELVAAGVKIPVGIAIFLLVGFVSIFRRRVRFAELSLIIPGCLALLSVLSSNMSIGFRHSIPWYVLAMMFASRFAIAQTPSLSYSEETDESPGRSGSSDYSARRSSYPSPGVRKRGTSLQTCFGVVAWSGVIATLIQGAMWHPDELSFTNGLWRNPQAIVSDSNIDWGQSLKQIRIWLDTHPHEGRPVYAQLFIPDTHGVGFDHYLGGRAQWISDGPPDHGLLIVSPVMMWGAYAPPERFARLRDVAPIAIIGHCIRVYDLDEVTERSGSSVQ